MLETLLPLATVPVASVYTFRPFTLSLTRLTVPLCRLTGPYSVERMRQTLPRDGGIMRFND